MNVELTLSEKILGKTGRSNTVINLIITLVKYYIYKQKMNKLYPTFEGAKREIVHYRELESHIYRRKMKTAEFVKRWGVFERLI